MKYYLKTYGCKVNQYDSQVLREKLNREQNSETRDIEDADIAIINSCTVTSNADKECRQLVRKISQKRPHIEILLAGCYAKRASSELKAISNQVKILSLLSLKKQTQGIIGFRNHSRAFVKLQDGCNAFCTYCVVPYVRQKLESKPFKEALREIKGLVENGFSELVLCGIRLGKYDFGLAAFLREILKLSGNFRVRLSSLELEEATGELLELMASNKDKICAHLHIPLQSGSNRILKLMNRPYNTEDFIKKINEIRSLIPDIALTTDVIVGFPGEEDDDFKRTAALIEKVKFSRLHVFRYSARPNTKASGFSNHVAPVVAYDRFKILESLDIKLREDYLRKFVGTRRCAVREEGKNSALTDNYLSLPLKGALPVDCGPIFNVIIKDYNGKIWAQINS